MQSTLNKLYKIIAAIIVTVGLGSCSSLTDPDHPLPSLFSVFATLEAHTSTGATFTVQSEPDSNPITLTTTADLKAEHLETGKRYIIVYSNGDTYDPYIPGAIDLKNVLNVANGEVQTASLADIQHMMSVAYQAEAVFRTGEYVNVQLKVPSTATPRSFNLYADQTTLSSPYPDLYLVYDITSSGLSYTTAFGSFNIATVWNAESCRGVTIHMPDAQPFQLTKENKSDK